MGCNFNIEKEIRIGNNVNNNNHGRNDRRKPRLTLVKLENKSQKYDILGEARKLSKDVEEVYRKIFISPDLTLVGREKTENCETNCGKREKMERGAGTLRGEN